MWIGVTNILVNDQSKALRFYTDILGFLPKQDFPVDEDGGRFITVTSPEGKNDVELFLEPDGNPGIQIQGEPAAQVYKRTLFDAGLPYTMFFVDDVAKEHERLTAKGVRFTQEPTTDGPVTTAVFDDTCGNLIMIVAQ